MIQVLKSDVKNLLFLSKNYDQFYDQILLGSQLVSWERIWKPNLTQSRIPGAGVSKRFYSYPV